MSRSTSAALARLTSASTSPVSKWTTLSTSRLLYGSPQRSTGMWITIGLREWAGRFGRDTSGREDTSVYTDGGRGRDLVERADAADAVPRVLGGRGLAFALVALGEPGHEELFRECGQEYPTRAADRDHLVVVLELHHLRDGPRLRRVVRDLVVLRRGRHLGGGQAHQRVAV